MVWVSVLNMMNGLGICIIHDGLFGYLYYTWWMVWVSVLYMMDCLGICIIHDGLSGYLYYTWWIVWVSVLNMIDGLGICIKHDGWSRLAEPCENQGFLLTNLFFQHQTRSEILSLFCMLFFLSVCVMSIGEIGHRFPGLGGFKRRHHREAFQSENIWQHFSTAAGPVAQMDVHAVI
jgi:hypothetical protein